MLSHAEHVELGRISRDSPKDVMIATTRWVTFKSLEKKGLVENLGLVSRQGRAPGMVYSFAITTAGKEATP